MGRARAAISRRRSPARREPSGYWLDRWRLADLTETAPAGSGDVLDMAHARVRTRHARTALTITMLFDMASHDLSRRVASHTEDLRVLGDDIPQIRDDVAEIRSVQAKHGTMLEAHGTMLEALSRQLDELRGRVDEGFAAILRRLGEEPTSNS